MLTSSGEVKAIVLLLAVLAAILVGACIIYGAEHWGKHPHEAEGEADDGLEQSQVHEQEEKKNDE